MKTNQGIPTVEVRLHFQPKARGRKRAVIGPPPPTPDVPAGRVPRVSRLLALAIRFEGLIQDGHVEDYAEIARLGHVTKARASQVMSLTLLAPDIQAEILTLPRVKGERETVSERDLRAICAVPDWRKQRRMWRELMNVRPASC